ncbi:hypothetical protein C8R43DRAFT_403314 [Mycena crocata]|nr:hypothetical protein C8R43DRAFT_403314 [Mycena crocata]
MRLGQFSASVSVDGVELAEYAPEYSPDGKEATCWIPSEEGKQFCLKWTNNQASKHQIIMGRVHVDGTACDGTYMRVQGGKHRFSMGSRDSVPTSATTRRPLLFAKQVLTDDDAYLNDAVPLDLGTIKVNLSEVGDVVHTTRAKYAACAPLVLHERSKKAIGHSVQFGEQYSSHRPSRITEIVVKKKLVIFVFKYRPIGLLRAQGIAPPEVRDERAASPADVLDVTTISDDDEENVDDAAEIKKLEARLSALKDKNKKKRVKAEPSEVKKEIKNEERIFQPGEVIDLT